MNNGEIKVKKNYFKVKFEDKLFFVERKITKASLETGIARAQNDHDHYDDIIAVYFESNMCHTCTRGSYYGNKLKKIIADKLSKGEF